MTAKISPPRLGQSMSDLFLQEFRDLRASIEAGNATVGRKLDEMKDMMSDLSGDQRVLRRDVDEQAKDIDRLFTATREVTASHGELNSEVRISLRNTRWALLTGVPVFAGVLKWMEHKFLGE